MEETKGLQNNLNDEANNEAEENIEVEEEKQPIDSVVKVEIEDGGFSAKINVRSPQNGGAEVTHELIKSALEEAGVTYGINQRVIALIVVSKKYDEWFTIANHAPAEDGKDGSVEYLFEQKTSGLPKEDARGYVDFKNLGTVRNITSGTVIANIIKETEGKPGINVRNEPINQKAGRPPKVTFAENIAVSEDGLNLVATADGNLAFSNGRFTVQTTLKLDGDIDVATGNIDFIGDVSIRGDVKEGFSVTAGKSITISGGAFGANVKAEGDIVIKNGAIGSNIEAKGKVDINFCENTKIKCTELLKARSLFFCDVFCNGEIEVTAGNGSIIGGKTVSTKNLHANHIGSKNYTATEIVIGDNAIKLQEREELSQKMEQLNIDEEKCMKIVEFLKIKKEQLGYIPKDKVDILNSAAKTAILSREEKEKITKRIEEIDIYLQTKQNLYVNCKKELNPGSKIVINDSVITINVLYQHCQVGLGDDGIEIRTL